MEGMVYVWYGMDVESCGVAYIVMVKVESHAARWNTRGGRILMWAAAKGDPRQPQLPAVHHASLPPQNSSTPHLLAPARQITVAQLPGGMTRRKSSTTEAR
eukprot:1161256-Pelagomonas_calceolata.AAC.5